MYVIVHPVVWQYEISLVMIHDRVERIEQCRVLTPTTCTVTNSWGDTIALVHKTHFLSALPNYCLGRPGIVMHTAGIIYRWHVCGVVRSRTTCSGVLWVFPYYKQTL